MTPLLAASAVAFSFLPLAAAERLWFAAPLIVTVSLVYASTRHEETRPILMHAARFAMWILVFMVLVVVVMQVMGALQ